MAIPAFAAGAAGFASKIASGALGKTVGANSAFSKLTTGQQLAIGASIESGRRAASSAHGKRNREQ